MSKRMRKDAPLRSLEEEVAALSAGSPAPLVAAVYDSGNVTRAAASDGSSATHAAELLTSRFEIGSVTKVLTGTLLGVLVESGDINPDTPVDELLGKSLHWRDGSVAKIGGSQR